MKNIDLIKMALQNLLRRKMRTILTVLGVIIGTASIVVMLSLGLGMKSSMESQLNRMGSMNTITVYPGYNSRVISSSSSSTTVVTSSKRNDEPQMLTDEIVNEIANIPHITNIMKTIRSSLRFVSGTKTAYVQVIGIDPAVMEDFDFKVGEGRLLSQEDTNGIFFGAEVPYQFMDTRSRGRDEYFMYGGDDERAEPEVDVFNDSLVMTFDMSYGERTSGSARKAKRYKVSAVGTSPQGEYNETSWQAYVNIDYLLKITKENERYQENDQQGSRRRKTETEYDQLKVKVDDIKNVKEVQEQIMALGMNANSLTDMMNEMKKTSNIIQAVLGGIGAISLLVAALGITNTMVMSIYERTREIGIMKVIGCLLGKIRNMFLLEAAMIGFFGGILGIGISSGISFGLNKFLAPVFMGGMGGADSLKISVMPLWLILASLLFSTMVGVVSGLYPARRAMRLSALEAIRND